MIYVKISFVLDIRTRTPFITISYPTFDFPPVFARFFWASVAGHCYTTLFFVIAKKAHATIQLLLHPVTIRGNVLYSFTSATALCITHSNKKILECVLPED